MKSGLKISNEAVIRAYNSGESMGSIARAFGTYPTSIKRILEKNGVELRHDERKKGSFVIRDGEKLIEWAKAQGRLVTKAELAKVIGTKRLSPSYFTKYPELGQYVKTYNQKELTKYYDILYSWLKENNIPYKPKDRTRLGVSVDALLLGDYTGIAIQIIEKPTYISKSLYEERALIRVQRAKKEGIELIFLDEEQFEDLPGIKRLLDCIIKD